MKNYKQLLEALPSKTVVFAFGRFNPPTTGHELLVKVVKKLAAQNKADHAIYASKSQDAKKNPLPVDKKVHYLNLMFPGTNFVAANQNERTFIEAVKNLNKKFKNLIMVAGSDRIAEYEKILNKYNGTEFHYDSVRVISAGERDPDADDASGMSASKMRALAAKGNYKEFKKGLPSSLRDIDGKRLMNDIRVGMGLEVVKEQIVFNVDTIREQYYRGEIYHIGELVESADQTFEIVDRGSNYLVVVDSEGTTHRKWLKDVTLSENQIKEDVQSGPVPDEITFKGYTTQNLHHSEDARRAFMDTIQRAGNSDPVAVLNALKATDAFMKINDYHLEGEQAPDPKDMADWRAAHVKAKESLDRIGEFMHHEDYWHTHDHEIQDMISDFKEQGKGELRDSTNIEGTMLPEDLTNKTLKTNDKVKVARIIASMLGIENAEASTSPEQLVNSALRKVRSKALNADGLKILTQMLQLAHEVKIDYDRNLVPTKLKEDVVNTSSKRNFAKDRMRFSDYKKLTKGLKLESEDDSDNEDDDEKEEKPMHNKMGHTMHGVDDQLRIRKIKYKLGEEVEEIDEISQKLAGNYYGAATKKHLDKVGMKPNMYDRIKKDMGAKRKDGVDRALDRITGARKTNEETDKAAKDVAKATLAAKQAKEKETLSDKQAREKELLMKREEFDYEYSLEVLDEALASVDKGEYDYEGAMARTQLQTTLRNCQDLIDMLEDDENMPEWVQSKITLAQDYITSVRDYLQSREELGEEVAKATGGLKKACWKGYTAIGMKDKNGKKVPNCVPVKEEIDQHEQNLEDQMAQELELTDEQLDAIIDTAQDDDYLEAYEPEELGVIDADTGEEIEDEDTMKEEALMEVLSRIERIRAKARFARTASKRERRVQIALKRHSDNKTINKRARRLAVSLMKKRLLRGRNVNSLSVGEKERIERVIERRKPVIGRVAMKLVSRVRGVEKARLSHSKYTKGAATATF